MKRRPVRTVLLGLLVGLCVSFGYVSLAQTSGVPMPLVTALQAAAVAADVELVVADVPSADVYLPSLADDWRTVLVQLASVHGLTVCELGPRTLLVSASEHARRLCGEAAGELVQEEHAGEPDVIAEPVVVDEAEAVPLAETVRYRLRIVQLDETRAASLGIDWAGRAFETASLLAGGVALVELGFMPSPALDDVLIFLEREGIATRLEDLELGGILGRPVTFDRGGSINVSLPSEGGGIQRSFTYGLQVTVTGERHGDGLLLEYVISDSNPSNVADPENIQLTATSTRSVTRAGCGESVVLASLYSARDEGQGSALPVIGRVPGVGYLGGVGTDTIGRVAVVVTLDVMCGAA